MLKRLFLAAGILAGSLGVASTVGAAVDYSEIIEQESAWIESLQQPSGAIVMTREHTYEVEGKRYYKIEPYFANLALVGMLENPDPGKLQTARKWMEWYFSHMNAPDYNGALGSVYVHYADPVTQAETATPGTLAHGNYDSTDSYAATFLSLTRKYIESGGDRSFVLGKKAELETIAGAMLSTLQPNGLTWAKPDYAIPYLMDNTEVHTGLVDIEWLERQVFGDAVKANEYEIKKKASLAGIELMWNPAKDNYDFYECGHCSGGTSDWSSFYPGATAQMYPIWHNILTPPSERAVRLYQKLNESHPGWPELSTPDAFPWAILAYTGALMDDKERVDTFLSSVKSAYLDKSRGWPYYNLEAGFTIRAAKTVRDKSNLALGAPVLGSTAQHLAGNVTNGVLSDSWVISKDRNHHLEAEVAEDIVERGQETAGKKGPSKAWLRLDLGTAEPLNRLLIKWGKDHAKAYTIQTSGDGIHFEDVYKVKGSDGGKDEIALPGAEARYVRLIFTDISRKAGMEIREIEIY
ncbi:discoidin domain-containing protein [Paenibacillus puldeungensis]|uniref:Discoidin domain-containing protein n=1 Tax=Paenibacillus puldeungensis TaxID=696536 RepID=A0ABW3RUJ7_9BACL